MHLHCAMNFFTWLKTDWSLIRPKCMKTLFLYIRNINSESNKFQNVSFSPEKKSENLISHFSKVFQQIYFIYFDDLLVVFEMHVICFNQKNDFFPFRVDFRRSASNTKFEITKLYMKFCPQISLSTWEPKTSLLLCSTGQSGQKRRLIAFGQLVIFCEMYMWIDFGSFTSCESCDMNVLNASLYVVC